MNAITATSRSAAIGRINPVTKLAASAILALALVPSIDWVSGGVALALELLLLPFAGLTARTLIVRTSPVWIAAILGGITIVLYGQGSGEEHFRFLLIRVTDGSIELGIATVLRVLAIGLPALVLFLTVDPTDLADGLGQLLRLPARFVLGGLAGLRLMVLFTQDWKSLELARRARGISDRGRLRRFLGQAFALLVLSIRRGSKLATAMEARGFGRTGARTWARASTLARADAALLLIVLAIAAIAVSASVITGEWNVIIGG